MSRIETPCGSAKKVLGVDNVYSGGLFLDSDSESSASFTRRALDCGIENTILIWARGGQTRDDEIGGVGGAAGLKATDVTATWRTHSWRRVRLDREISLPQTRGTNQAQDSAM